ncbi:uncharacterized protein LOC121596448 [Anopheles merus]|uniref:uncharacterized protein LOC121596448 n=1 Tax=Anopheles merus TaxID=30066 RepID=UPI001BE4BEB2|nr:uncharacterized protein LOC121596448 [Anopheles merus]
MQEPVLEQDPAADRDPFLSAGSDSDQEDGSSSSSEGSSVASSSSGSISVSFPARAAGALCPVAGENVKIIVEPGNEAESINEQSVKVRKLKTYQKLNLATLCVCERQKKKKKVTNDPLIARVVFVHVFSCSCLSVCVCTRPLLAELAAWDRPH